ncbi:MAG: molybdopterin molybdenumtransferase MoeA [Microbacteriaceae bacterium]|nr:MAG: molybdopterin molybdenumtransferase MoeA [Microbacteriaceae bacterium]
MSKRADGAGAAQDGAVQSSTVQNDTVLYRADWHAARRLAYRLPSALGAETVPLAEAIGRRSANGITALCDVPHYASSAMDGWAVAGDAPWRLVESGPLQSGEATRIVTGGLIPAGARAVLRSENGIANERVLERGPEASAGEPVDGMHIRPPGEEARRGEQVSPAGIVLNPAHIAVAAVCGNDTLEVVQQVQVCLILTGDEVVTEGIPAPGRVRDSFGPQLPALLAMFGAVVGSKQRLPDRLDALVDALSGTCPSTADSRLVVTTGGTGRSDADHLHQALNRVGARILIDGIAMRPGGPSLLAVLPDGRYLLGLPGNPLAAMMGLFTLLPPLLAGLLGGPEPTLEHVTAGRALADGRGRTRLIPYLLEHGRAVPTGWHGSGMLRGLADADGVLVCPSSGASAADTLEAINLPWAVERRTTEPAM